VTPLTAKENIWITEIAGRLRLIQAGLAIADPEKRRELLQEEVVRSLKDVPPANRKGYLNALLARFPIAGQIAKATPAVQPVQSAPPASAEAPESPEQLLERFVAAASKIAPEKRTELSRRLYESGFGWVDRGALVVEMSAELRQKLGLQDDQQPNLTRLVELAAFLTDLLSRLDQTALGTLRELSPKSPLLKRSADFRKTAVRYLTGEKDPLEPHLRAISGLLGALLASMLGGGRLFGQQYVERLSPTAIEDVVIGEGAGKLFGPSKKELCWNKYSDLARDFATAEVIDKQIRDCFARFVETKVLGT